MDEVKRQRPDASITVLEMDSTSLLKALKRGEIDLALGRFYSAEPPIKLKPLVKDQLHVALPPNHELLNKDRIHLADLADHDWVHFPRRINPRNFDMVIAAYNEHGFSPRMMHQVTNQLSQIAFVACGFGVALLPKSFTNFYQGYAEFRPLTPRLEINTVAAAWNESTPLVETIVSLAGQGNAMRESRLATRIGAG